MRYSKKHSFAILVGIFIAGCSEFIVVEAPRTDLVRATVFTDDKPATAAIVDIYENMSEGGFASGNGYNSFTLLSSFSSDEWMNVNNSQSEYQQFSDNELDFRSFFVGNAWADLYRYIYKANALIEGLASSSGVSEPLKKQLEGEAKFIRAFCHFYLVNLWGDIPLVLTTDYRANSRIARTDKIEVYEQIINDLNEAQMLLSNDYSFSESERVRPNKWVAKAFLARVYLYTEDWTNAEILATSVIDNTNLFNLESDLGSVFLKNSRESIWQLHSNTIPNDLICFLITTGPIHGQLRPEFMDVFEEEDARKAQWIDSVTNAQNIYFFPAKYKGVDPVTEYSTVMRLAEQFLIRAEARAQLNKLTGAGSAQSDLNQIRSRANLSNTTAVTKDDLLEEIVHERRVELFSEWGHRWLDLKRTGRLDDVLSSLKPDTWQATDALYPIPESQILNDPAMAQSQNPGY